ncbi:hypothetical protein AOE01nite_22500 [Acetobacter oeni]|uniref:Uncharacterized protein n=1 Tax=Acetobacter oeni TaxID=304077 RepID=A0A511XM65_9PROT|nr:hypothetical protein [Acetobacter oeni]GBR08457.1 hypothetical protein AA21952_2623 [Acetobacter oeni LMG 21952]GEN64026.1 hypothetical protein AOE01nite_22500 [Acetobacter oeni]
MTVVSPVSDDFFCFIREIRQQNIGSFEITDLSCGQVEPDRTTLTIAYSMQF